MIIIVVIIILLVVVTMIIKSLSQAHLAHCRQVLGVIFVIMDQLVMLIKVLIF